jgi:hypothetical protein
MAKPIAHSFSALETFEQCPKKYYHLKIAKDVKDSQSSFGTYGLDGHKHFENRLISGKKLPMDFAHHEPVLAVLDNAAGEGLPEQKLAITKEFKPTGWFDADVWLRAVIDYVKIDNNLAVIVDHKFGKLKDNFDQVHLCAAVFSCYEPRVNTFDTAYYWAKEKKLTRSMISIEDIPRVWAKFLPKFQRIEAAAKTTDFPAKKNGLCKNYCPVFSCVHNGRNKA